MRREKFVLFSLFLLLVAAAIVIAQDADPEPSPIILTSPPEQFVDVAASEESTRTIQIPLEPVAVDASNDCQGATVLTVPGGGSQIVNGFDTAVTDPQINQCTFGDPPGTQGFRTAWFQFTAPNNGIAIIDTFGSSYDTVVGIYRDENPATTAVCSELELLACNDDHNGFSARVEATVEKDVTYYVEVADWQAGVSGNAQLLLSLQVKDIDSIWEPIGSMTSPRTRHATVVVNNSIYAIGGQQNVLGNPEISNRLDRYNTGSRAWADPAPAQIPGIGLSNTTAVYVNKQAGDGKCSQGCIYVPGGYNGGSSYDGTHWAYDIATNGWVERANIYNLSPLTGAFAWSTAVNHPNHTGYYLIGGLTTQPAITTTAQAHNNVYFYNVNSNTWLNNPPNLNSARYGHMAARFGNTICVVGGIGTGLVLLPTGECLNTASATATWQSSIPALNEPRYGAGSAIGSDGNWYIFGGSDANHQAISSIEKYDPRNPGAGWQKLTVNYDLGASEGVLERAWPRGGFVGNHLWAIGGNATEATYPAISLIERLFLGPQIEYLPFIGETDVVGDDTIATADRVGFNNTITSNFNVQLDYFDTYYFDLPTTDQINVKLSQIPSGSDYNIQVYDDNKLLWGTGVHLGNVDENVQLTLNPGRYYVVVERVSPFGIPNTANYKLRIER